MPKLLDARIDYLIGTDKRSITLDDQGQPIRMTAYNCTGRERASYQQALHAVWSRNGIFTEPVKNPRRIHLIER
ncbi:hypothetical protein [Actinomadura macra]|uniref:hypothetical protein n=1 Tax=Actinomadura macra TaxID=46164 RepID=UPI00082F2B0B|nr:hypothetical protein [Actinomadura macra]